MNLNNLTQLNSLYIRKNFGLKIEISEEKLSNLKENEDGAADMLSDIVPSKTKMNHYD